MTAIAMVYEHLCMDPYEARNLITCGDLLTPHHVGESQLRFNHPSLNWWLKSAGHRLIDHTIDDRPQRYIYATSTFNGPSYWSGWPGNEHGFRSLFDYIPSVVIDDLHAGRALLLIDQMMEGYSDDRLWPWFHAEMDRNQLPDGCILYWSGNHHEAGRYAAWCNDWQLKSRIHVGSLRHLEMISHNNFGGRQHTNWRQRMLRRQRLPGIKLYNCLNRAQRYHRNVMYMELWSADLLGQGLVSMEGLGWDWKLSADDRPWTSQQVRDAAAMLPLKIDLPDFATNPAFDINRDIYDRSYLSIITETLADDQPHSLFVTEKVFKCMHQSHPFMVLGQRGYLHQLREWGYETFSDMWDESYDDLDDMHDRAKAIACELSQLSMRTDMANVIADMCGILQHNLDHFLSRTCRTSELDHVADLLIRHMDPG